MYEFYKNYWNPRNNAKGDPSLIIGRSDGKRGKRSEHDDEGKRTKGGSMVDIKKGRETRSLRIC